jgi:hypothetical protein
VEFFDDGHVRCYAAGDAADVARGALTMTESRRQLAEWCGARGIRERSRTSTG